MNDIGYPRVLLLGIALLVSACGGGGGSGGDGDAVLVPAGSAGPIRDDEGADQPAGTPDRWFATYLTPDDVAPCSSEDLKRWIDHDMRDYYIYADRVPRLPLEAYGNENALARALRVAPDEFSSVGDQQQYDARYEEGIVVDFGFRWSLVNGRVRFLRVDEGSSAAAGGLLRGDTLIAIDGVSVDQLSEDDYRQLYAMPQGESARFTVQTGQQRVRDIDIALTPYSFDTVPLVQSIEYTDGRNVGYLVVSSFLEPTDEQLDRAFEFLAEQGVGELVLDLRYNGGGRSSVGNRLGSRLGGRAVIDQVYAYQTRNATYSAFDEVEWFREVERSLELSRLVVLTTHRSASASENLINGLRPYLDVTVIGETTRGKPFSSQGLNYCGRTASLMNSIISNSVGVSVAGGIAPDCQVMDTPDFPIDDNRDNLRAAALDYLENGSCPTATVLRTGPAMQADLPEGDAFRPMALR